MLNKILAHKDLIVSSTSLIAEVGVVMVLGELLNTVKPTNANILKRIGFGIGVSVITFVVSNSIMKVVEEEVTDTIYSLDRAHLGSQLF